MLRRVFLFFRDLYRYVAFPDTRFRGVFATFDDAVAHAPRSRQVGYDDPGLAAAYQSRLNTVRDASDYPALFHLSRILKGPCTVLDFGGNLGVHYLRYSGLLDLTHVTWIVWDVAAMVDAGQKQFGATPNLRFISDFEEIRNEPVDVFLSCGAMQYVEYVESAADLLQRIAECASRPSHILIDQVPLYEGARFVTLQNGGRVVYPQYVFNRAEFIQSVAGLGYSLMDAWDDHLDSCVIPFHPEKSVRAYSGLHFADSKKQ